MQCSLPINASQLVLVLQYQPSGHRLQNHFHEVERKFLRVNSILTWSILSEKIYRILVLNFPRRLSFSLKTSGWNGKMSDSCVQGRFADTLLVLCPFFLGPHIVPITNIFCPASKCHGCQVYSVLKFSPLGNSHYLNIFWLAQKQISESGWNPAGNFNPVGEYVVDFCCRMWSMQWSWRDAWWGRARTSFEHSCCLHLFSSLTSVNSTLAWFPSCPSAQSSSPIPRTASPGVSQSLALSRLLFWLHTLFGGNAVHLHSSQIYPPSSELCLGVHSHIQVSIWNFF